MKYFCRLSFTALLVSLAQLPLQAQSSFILANATDNAFALSASGKSTPIYIDERDYPGVIRAAKDLQADIERVTSTKPELFTSSPSGKEIVIIGTIGKSNLITQLVQNNKINIQGVEGKWETFLIQVVEKPLPGVERAMVIAGSDKRGTIFGIYEVSRQIGVSPWYWWADVPVKKQPSLYVEPGRYVQGEPPVKYRGIFINDEEPALGRWAVANYGGFTSEFYKKVFELMLRMKANYLWPAMWWASFNSDDPLNPELAEEYGIVMGTTHHEPMNRAHAEWRKTGKGPWNYETNDSTLRKFWRDGIERIGDNETIISLGMRGDGDMAMSKETNIALLEKIVKDQREIITQVTGKNINQTPQLWALYKEVQDYYDQGMRVPDDVTLLLCDDNWGNIRKLPKVGDSLRSGSYGIYYHFDYVGGPRNYKWVNTNHISRIWEQMNLAYRYGANRIWIVNVGDIKPMEFPTEFFLDYAWNPEAWNQNNLDDYAEQWVTRQFGNAHAKEIAEIISLYTKYNTRRKPELLSAETYSLTDYREAERIVNEYNTLVERAERINTLLLPEYRDAYFQLVLHPVKACANLNELWVTVAKNRLYAQQERASANDLAIKAKKLFEADSALSHYYNKIVAGGKWNHMMDQTHISYTYWQQPPKDTLPEVKYLTIPQRAEMGIAVEGSTATWPSSAETAVLPTFDIYHQQSYFIDIFNKGSKPFQFTVQSDVPWVTVSAKEGNVEKEQRIYVSINWKTVKKGMSEAFLKISQKDGAPVTIKLIVNNPLLMRRKAANGFVENNQYISIEAEHFTRKINASTIEWQVIPDIGKTGSGVTVSPVTSASVTPGENTPRLEYAINTTSANEIKINACFSPTLNFNASEGLRYAISIDNAPPQIINLHEGYSTNVWGKWVADNIIIKISNHGKLTPGNHIIKFWMVDPGVVLQKLVVDLGGLKPSYLGPPETKNLIR